MGHSSSNATGAPAERSFAPQVLREYALLADGERGALIGPCGEIVWMCLPRWHSEAVFGSLIGGHGVYAITPEARFVWGGCYEPGSLIWRSRWITNGGVIGSREALAFPGSRHQAVILRSLTAEEGPARLRVVLDPRAGFSGPGLTGLQAGDGWWAGRFGALYLRWSGDVAPAQVRAGPHGQWLAMTLSLARGEQRHLVLELSERPFQGAPAPPGRLWRATEEAWQHSTPALTQVIATRDARHAHAVMRGLTSADGGMAGAATTSLPERAEAGRNYDYRYAWIRDQCFAGRAAAAAGAPELLDTAVGFISARLHDHGPNLAPAYTVDGHPVPTQRHLGLPGYPGGADVAGNWVTKQFQLDVFGEALLLLAAAARHGRLPAAGAEAARTAAEAIAARWRESDAGIWEIEDRAWTHSRLICAAGLRAIAAASPPVPGGDWAALADTIVADTAAHATHPSGRWQRAPDDPRLDGALLLPALRGAVPACDRRSLATLRGYESELTQDGYAYRFRHDQRPLDSAEGAFLLCGFILALAHHQQGDEVRAARWFERNRATCGPAGLFSEEYDVTERQLRGNLPQSFVHAVMLECAARLAAPWNGEDGKEGRGHP